MNEDEGQLIHDLGNEFYREYGDLLQKYIDKVPPHLHLVMVHRLAELSNPFSSRAQFPLSE